MKKYDALIFGAAAVAVLSAFVWFIARGGGPASGETPTISIRVPSDTPTTIDPGDTDSPEDTGPPPSDTPMPGVTESGEPYVLLGRCRVFRGERPRIEIPAETRMKAGPLEFLICSPRGKVHETLLVIDDEPRRLMAALISMGLEPTADRFQSRGELRPIGGNGVRIYVTWDGMTDAFPVEDWPGTDPRYGVRVESLLRDLGRDAAMPPAVWLYTGSYTTFHQGLERDIFVADYAGAFAAVYHDPVAVLDNPHPEGADDNNYIPYTDRLPDPGTKVTLTLVADTWVVPDDYPAERPDNTIWQTDNGNFHPFDWDLFNERTQSVVAEETGFTFDDFGGFGPHYFVTEAEAVWWLNQESAAVEALSKPAEGGEGGDGGIELVLPPGHLLIERGFKNGDVITEIDSEVPVGNLSELLLNAARKHDGRIYMTLRRGTATVTQAIILLGPEWKPSRGPGPGPMPSPSPSESETPREGE